MIQTIIIIINKIIKMPIRDKDLEAHLQVNNNNSRIV